MRFLVLLLLVAGCSHVSVDASSNTSSGTVVGGQAGLHVESRSLAALAIAGMFLAAAAEDAREPRSASRYYLPSFSTFSDWFRGTPPVELDPSRNISEQDCTRPLDPSLGNIRCK
jgi:hypothetical protein